MRGTLARQVVFFSWLSILPGSLRRDVTKPIEETGRLVGKLLAHGTAVEEIAEVLLVSAMAVMAHGKSRDDPGILCEWLKGHMTQEMIAHLQAGVRKLDQEHPARRRVVPFPGRITRRPPLSR